MKLRDAVIDVSPLRLSREFRVVFTARLISVFGLGFALVALPLQVYSATQSSVLVAVVSAVNGASIFGGTLVGGVLADRFSRRALIVTGRAAATLAFTGLALNALWAARGDAAASFAVICVCAALNGFVGTFSNVALQAAVPGLLPRDRLPAAGALLALTGQLGSIVAPALSGAIVALWGYPAVFGITAAVCALTTGLVLLLPPLTPTRGEHADGRSMAAAAVDGMRFAVRHRTVGPLLLLGFVQLLFATPYVLIPEITDTVLHAGETAAGLLYSASALGAVLASLASGWTRTARRSGAVLLAAVACCGLASAAFGASTQLALAAAALVALGFAEIVEEILRFTLLQSHTPDAMRGRVNSVWSAQNTVGGALGALALGALAPLIGAGGAVVAGGAVTVAAVGALTVAFPGLRRAVTADSADTADTGESAETVEPGNPRNAGAGEAATRGAHERAEGGAADADLTG